MAPVKPTGRTIEHPVLAELKLSAALREVDALLNERCPRRLVVHPCAGGRSTFLPLGEVMPDVGTGYGATIWEWMHSRRPDDRIE